MPSTGHSFTSSDISISAREPFLTEKINQRDFNVMNAGIYSNFYVSPAGSALTVTVQGGTALVPTSTEQLLGIKSVPFNIDLSAYASQQVVLALYATYTTSSTTAEVRVYTQAEYDALVDKSVVIPIAEVDVPASGVIPSSDITFNLTTYAWKRGLSGAIDPYTALPIPDYYVWDSAAESNLNIFLGNIGTLINASAGSPTPGTLTTASYVATPLYVSRSAGTSEFSGFGGTYPIILRISRIIAVASTSGGADTIRAKLTFEGGGVEYVPLDGNQVISGYVYHSVVNTNPIIELRVEFNGYTTTATSTDLFNITSIDILVPRTEVTSNQKARVRRTSLKTLLYPDNDPADSDVASISLDSSTDEVEVKGESLLYKPVLAPKHGLRIKADRGAVVPGLEIESIGSGSQVITEEYYDTYEDIKFYNGTVLVERANGNLTGSEDTSQWTVEKVFDPATGITSIGSRDSGDAATWTAGTPPKKFIQLDGGLVFPNTNIGIGKVLASPPDIEHVYLENTIKSKGVITANSSTSPTVSGAYNVGAVSAATTTVTVPFATNLPDSNYVVNVTVQSSSGVTSFVPKVLSRGVSNFTFEVSSGSLYDFTATSGLIVMFMVV